MTRPSDTDVGLALVTGVTRRVGIGWAVASRLVADGFGVAVSGWRDHDERMSWGADPSAPDLAVPFYEVDLEDPDAASALVPTVTRELVPLRTLVLCHTESVDSDIRSTTVDSFDRHMAVNARATWLLIQSFAGQFAASAHKILGHHATRR